MSTRMPVQEILTPFGAARCTGFWKRDRFYGRATGSVEVLHWMFPHAVAIEQRSRQGARHEFRLSEQPIITRGSLSNVLSDWAAAWAERSCLGTTSAGPRGGPMGSLNAPVTLADLFERFITAQRGQVSNTTLAKYECHRDRWLACLPGNLRLQVLTPERILIARSTMTGTVSPVTVNNTMTTLKRMLRFAEDQRWIVQIRMQGIRPLKTSKYLADWWEPREVAIAMGCAESDRAQTTAVLMLGCGIYLGLRKDEMVNLRWQDLDLDHKNPDGLPAPVCRIRCDDEWKPKSAQPRCIPIPHEFWHILLRCRKAEGYVLSPERKKPKRGGTKRVYRYDCAKVWSRVHDAAVAKGAKPIRFHDLRHSYASLMLSGGMSAEKVAKWLGHSSTRMVFQVYGHLLAYDDTINDVTFRERADERVIQMPAR